MPLSATPYSFPALPKQSFHGLPGLLADSLPDRFGNALIDAWLARQGLPLSSFTALDRLCYIGTRGMGALEFQPSSGPSLQDEPLAVSELVSLASQVLSSRGALSTELSAQGLAQILRVGTSAGGARAKAVLSWNPKTGELRSGQLPPPPGFESWLLKFDGVAANRDRELCDPMGYGRVEMAYAEMAYAAGVEMSACRLFEEGSRAHFMTRRFDRPVGGGKLHMQSLAALAHLDFNQAGAHSYEQAFALIRSMGLGMAAIEQQFLRMAFNIVARNQDDHVKNIAFLMNQAGEWTLSPAYDVTYSYNPDGAWTQQHQMSMQGKRASFERQDFSALAQHLSMKRGRGLALLDQTLEAVSGWPAHAHHAGVPPAWARQIATHHRLSLRTD